MLACLSRRRSRVQIPSRALLESGGAVRKSAKRPSSNLGDLRVRVPPAPLNNNMRRLGHWQAQLAVTQPSLEDLQVQFLLVAPRHYGSFVYRYRTPAPQAAKAGSTPARATENDHVVELADTRRSDRRALAALGVRVSPWSLTHCRRGRCPTGRAPCEAWSKAGPPGSIPGPATAGGPVLSPAS